ncbi:class I adenylate-forming enzyme family protein [Pseudonocardia sp. WMMC193]|uniref:class I adenylate-forming enzyme family protein n=1 Tax=Pseudonocardia sp. WMMC193 TaxID=2911965 RepID=UPI001F3C1980|nr:AMP-binding protein [Pseudonocardia sp. WMMC193]MCF7550531.1 AMP-binding protein [Pseudonocardia sp. WMMC193]
MLIGDVLSFTAARRADEPALVFEDRTWTYAELDREVRRLADGLTRHAEPGDRIAILTENNAEYVQAYYGVPAAGMALVFLNYRLSPREVALNLEDCAPTVLITERKYLETARRASADVSSIRTLVCLDGPADGALTWADLLGDDVDPPRVDETLPAWLIYTSGTTGRAKGAVLTHRNVVAAVLNSLISWEHDHDPGVSLMPWPLCHIAGYGVPMAHLRGDAMVLLRRYDAVGFLEAVQTHRVRQTSVAPTMMAMLLRHSRFAEFDLSSLRRISYGSAPMPAAVLREAMAALPTVRWQTGFGMTELAGNVVCHGSADHVRALESDESLLTSVGKPQYLTTVRIVDEEGREVADDEVGEIVVRGDQVCAGYWNRPEATAEAVRGGWFHSGDLGRRDARGYWYVVDRKKDMILTGGENVYSREVEEVLFQHPDVAAAAVVGQPDEVWGQLVVAVVEAREGHTVTEEGVRGFCRGLLAGYKIPRRVLVVPELPRTTSGKVRKPELRALVAETAEPAESPETPEIAARRG